MRIPLATTLKTRTGAPDKDARLKNSYVEVKGDQPIVRKRPSAQGGIATGTGVAQGGIGLHINGTPYFIGFWGDTMQTYTESGTESGLVNIPTTWLSGVSYVIGDWVDELDPEDDPFDPQLPKIRKYANAPNTNINPKTNSTVWTVTVPPSTRYYCTTGGFGAFPGVTGDICATVVTAVDSAYAIIPWKICGFGVDINSNRYWWEGPFTYAFPTSGCRTMYVIGTTCSETHYVYQENNNTFYLTQTA